MYVRILINIINKIKVTMLIRKIIILFMCKPTIITGLIIYVRKKINFLEIYLNI